MTVTVFVRSKSPRVNYDVIRLVYVYTVSYTQMRLCMFMYKTIALKPSLRRLFIEVLCLNTIFGRALKKKKNKFKLIIVTRISSQAYAGIMFCVMRTIFKGFKPLKPPFGSGLRIHVVFGENAFRELYYNCVWRVTRRRTSRHNESQRNSAYKGLDSDRESRNLRKKKND